MNIPTTEEHINDRGFATWFVAHSDTEGEVVINFSDCKEAMIEFARLHVQAQTEAILERLELRGEHNTIDKNIIINAYPLTNIK
jgi:hypothetical protein